MNNLNKKHSIDLAKMRPTCLKRISNNLPQKGRFLRQVFKSLLLLSNLHSSSTIDTFLIIKSILKGDLNFSIT